MSKRLLFKKNYFSIFNCIQFSSKTIYLCAYFFKAYNYLCILYLTHTSHGSDRMVVVFKLPVQSVPITTKVVSLNPVHGEVYLIQYYVIKFVTDFRQISVFLLVLRFPPPMKLTAMIEKNLTINTT